MLLRDAKKSAVAVWNNFFVGEMEQKQPIWCLKRKSLNINLLFIELLYKINITYVIMLILERKNGTPRVILTVQNVNIRDERVQHYLYLYLLTI